jgi:beta-lactamase superfamily II metal-dependent hydrolase
VKCEIEFLAVGEASKAGDAVVVRYGEPNQYDIMVVDAGMSDTGIEMAEHLTKYFGESVVVEHAVLTHSDLDHACGYRELLQRIPVMNIWLHIPWLFSDYALSFFAGQWTLKGLSDKIRAEYDVIDDIVSIAEKNGCSIQAPLQGDDIGPFRVLSPSWDNYCHLLPQFDKTPDADQEALEAIGMWIGVKPSGLRLLLSGLFEKASAAVQKLVPESWYGERLKDGGVTSASNESSVVLYGRSEKGPLLLTGDAGVNALTWAADYAEGIGLPLGSFDFVQIPHHGSRSNVGPTVLDRIVGPIVVEGSDPKSVAFVSAPADDDIHPRKMVVNAFIRRGAKVIATQGSAKIHYGGFPRREGYTSAVPLGFFTEVEDYD